MKAEVPNWILQCKMKIEFKDIHLHLKNVYGNQALELTTGKKKEDKNWHFAKKLRKLRNMKVMVIDTPRTVPKT